MGIEIISIDTRYLALQLREAGPGQKCSLHRRFVWDRMLKRVIYRDEGSLLRFVHREIQVLYFTTMELEVIT